MEKLDAVRRSVAAISGDHARFLLPSDNEELLGITLAMAGEIGALYEQIDTLQRVLVSELGLSREKLDSYLPDTAALSARGEWHDAFVSRVMRPLTQEIERLKAQDGIAVPLGSGGD